MSARLFLLRACGSLAGRYHRSLYGPAAVAGTVAWYVRPGLRRRLIDNLLPACAGDGRRAEREARAACRRAAAYWLDLVSLPHRDWDTFTTANVRVHGREHLAAIDRPGPVILAGCHSGNPEMAIRALAAHGRREFVALVEPLQPPALAQYMLGLRNTGPGAFLETGATGSRQALRVLRAGGTVGLVVDRDLAGNGVCVRLLGRSVRLPAGPWELARRTGATIVPAFAVRLRADRFAVTLCEPFTVPPVEGDDIPAAVQEAAQRWASHFEEQLYRFPGQWTVLEDYWRVHRCGES